MAGAEPLPEALARRPRRADARRNYEALVAAAREVFAAQGAGGSLEEIARRAQVGIGTLYRHFPTRRELLEAVYVDEVEALCQAAGDLAGLPPWDALVAWLHRFVEYVATKRALAEGLADSEVFASCRAVIHAEGEPMLRRAQQAGAARPDATFDDVLRLVSGITAASFTESGQRDKVLGFALDGLRAPRGD
ncbi:TetR/AcrR family transcriptional regulator [Micromonospora siamensis]|uniref:DNA-binding transcriptional regulator, AcrR family n=1 Tax=Micromonospora siamensis TaxID=299152 RepID=A0A1C5JG66_9ACTN|nr:TetR/AcrR family transcriptional regulator [Micromonospora siamensis]SCG69498.1 DNA-binding transcriptional regulator, AcrR family [Micromonospora siamensis]